MQANFYIACLDVFEQPAEGQFRVEIRGSQQCPSCPTFFPSVTATSTQGLYICRYSSQMAGLTPPPPFSPPIALFTLPLPCPPTPTHHPLTHSRDTTPGEGSGSRATVRWWWTRWSYGDVSSFTHSFAHLSNHPLTGSLTHSLASYVSRDSTTWGGVQVCTTSRY